MIKVGAIFSYYFSCIFFKYKLLITSYLNIFSRQSILPQSSGIICINSQGLCRIGHDRAKESILSISRSVEIRNPKALLPCIADNLSGNQNAHYEGNCRRHSRK